MSPIAGFFLFYVAGYVPYVAWKSSRRIRGGAELPSRNRLYLSSMFLEAVMLFLAWYAARAEWIVLFPRPEIGWFDAAVGLAWVGIKYLRFRWMFRRSEARERRRVLRHLAPRTPGESGTYILMVALAAVAEEAAYRGVMFQLAERATDSFWIAAISSAVVFGLAHLVQGGRPAVAAGILGLGNQIVVWLTGSLWIAIAAHFAYDVLVGLIAGRHGRRETSSRHRYEDREAGEGAE